MPKGTTSKETVETGSYGKKFFMVKFPELWGSTSYIRNIKKFLLAISILKDEAITFSRNVRDQTPRDVTAYLINELNSAQFRWIRMSSKTEFH